MYSSAASYINQNTVVFLASYFCFSFITSAMKLGDTLVSRGLLSKAKTVIMKH